MEQHSFLIFLRWCNRIIASILAILIILFVFGEGFPNFATVDARTALLFVCFIAIIIGLILGWFKEMSGGIILISGFVSFELIQYSATGNFATNALFAIFPLIGIIFIITSKSSKILTKKNK